MINAIALLGPAGTFSELAADTYTSQKNLSLKKIYFASITKALGAITSHTIAIAPIENLIDGFIGVTLDFLEQHRVKIIDEITIPIRHCLVRKKKEKKNIRKLFVQFSTQQQCRKFIETLAPKGIITTESNTVSLQEAMKNSLDAAIVPCHRAAGQLLICQKNVQDYPDNQTRFLVVAHPSVAQTYSFSSSYKTFLLIQHVQDKPGALRDLLAAFADRKINVTSIMSRPTRGKLGQYHFFIDLEGHQEQPHLREALTSIKKSNTIKILGSYLYEKKSAE